MKKILIGIWFVFLPMLLSAQEADIRPEIGLALSGGGAKGLAHIGLLMAIDSVGINIDYVAGTSMGAIVGGLYAAGYSGKDIEKLAREVDWERILSNKPKYDQLLLPYKDYRRQFVEIPVIGRKIYFGKGILESTELWLWLYEHFSGYNREIDFSDLPIPFRCVTARLDTGDAIVLDKGNLVNAIRASMAIPTVFTPVMIDGIPLVDGGLVRNFPVEEVRDMGASMVIGSSVADHLLSAEDLDNPLKVFYQIAFFAEKKDFIIQREATDILVEYPMGTYHMGSFASADEILQLGIDRGKEMIPLLKKFKDSLDRIYGYEEHRALNPPPAQEVKINKIVTEGLDPGFWQLYKNQMGFEENRVYGAGQISDNIRNIYLSGNFRKINYSFQQNGDESLDLHLNFQKHSEKFLRAGLSYNDDTGMGVKVGVGRNAPFSPFSSSSLSVSIGENMQVSIENIYFLGYGRNLFLTSAIAGELMKMTYYDPRLAARGVFRQNHLGADIGLSKLVTGNFQVGIGGRWEILTHRPESESSERLTGESNFLTAYFKWKFNNQDKAYNPGQGTKIDFETGWIFNQHPKLSYREDEDSALIPVEADRKNFSTVRFYSSHYHSFGKKTVFARLNAGLHFGNKLPYLHDFAIGGLGFAARNQVLFPGFRLNGISSSSAVSGQVGIRQNFSSRLSAYIAGNLLKYDFIQSNYGVFGRSPDMVWGLNLTAGYEFLLGPLELTLMYNSINDRIQPALNIGYSMNFSK